MKNTTPLTGILLDREDWKRMPEDADMAGTFFDGRMTTPIELYHKVGEFGTHAVIKAVGWETVMRNPKFYGMTEKQAEKAKEGAFTVPHDTREQKQTFDLPE